MDSSYKEKLHMDKVANGFTRKIPIPFYDYIWIYLRTMRKLELLQEKSGLISKIRYVINKFKLRQVSIKTGITIPPGTFEEGLTLYH